MMRSPITAISAFFTLCLLCAAATAQIDRMVGDFGEGHDRKSASLALAQKTVGDPHTKQNNVVDKKPARPLVSNERRTELTQFVEAHHPELQPLLNSLRENRPSYYESALQTLDRQVEKLQKLQRKSPERYEKSLGQWIAKSKIKLLSAQLATKQTADEKIAIREKLKQLIEKQHDLRVEQLAEDIAQTKSRLEQYETKMADLNANRDNEVKKKLDAIIRKAERISAAHRRAADKNAAKSIRKSDQEVPRKTDTAEPSVDKNQYLKREVDTTDSKDK